MCHNLPQPPKTKMYREGCRRFLHTLNPPRSAFLFQQYFGKVSSLHPTCASFLWPRHSRLACLIHEYYILEGTYYCACAGKDTCAKWRLRHSEMPVELSVLLSDICNIVTKDEAQSVIEPIGV